MNEIILNVLKNIPEIIKIGDEVYRSYSNVTDDDTLSIKYVNYNLRRQQYDYDKTQFNNPNFYYQIGEKSIDQEDKYLGEFIERYSKIRVTSEEIISEIKNKLSSLNYIDLGNEELESNPNIEYVVVSNVIENIPIGTIVTNVIQKWDYYSKDGYGFTIKETGESHSTYYPWALAENIPETWLLIEEIRKNTELAEHYEKSCKNSRFKLKTLENKIFK